MKILVQYSGGKDSQASLIFAVKNYGAANVTAVFCDTRWENAATYKHIQETTAALNVELVVLESEGLIQLSRRKKRFPSPNARFCTESLKIRPFIDYLLDTVRDNVIIIQGIRAAESAARSKMAAECRYFRSYFEPYGSDKRGNPRYHNYRKKDVISFCQQYDDSVVRPVFDFSEQEVIDYILSAGQRPNPLYYQGQRRVGCYPCIMTSGKQLHDLFEREPSLPALIAEVEQELSSPFFRYDSVPLKYRTGKVKDKEIYFTTALDLRDFLQGQNATLNLFDVETPSCSSYYHLCE